MRPLAIDLYTGLHGWADGLIAAGWRVVGFDLEDMSKLLGEPKPEHFSLVIQDVLTLHGAQFKDAELIVGSSPCPEFSWRAMPWKRAKAQTPDEVGLPAPDWWAKPDGKMTAAERAAWKEWRIAYPREPPTLGLELFHAQFRIQREASEAAGRHIPLVVENVRGAIPWVGRSRANFGSCHLWGDVPALMPIARQYGVSYAVKRTGRTMCFPEGSANPDAVKGRTGKLHWQDDATKIAGFRFDGSGRSFQSAAVAEATKAPGGTQWFNDGPRTPDSLASSSSRSPARKAASAKIAKIPRALSEWIGQVYLPREKAAA